MKFEYRYAGYRRFASPSVWRVWIEMDKIEGLKPSLYVTLRVEGVD